ncbi:MAG: ACP S-malonyltransferase [Deltaproteobacteria bacterium]|nr:ACP S-malonyltransferase [Deltaproteobacteria bacterium]
MDGKVLLFPGQGAQFVGMGRSLVERYPAARAVFDQADEALGFALSELCWNGPEDRLVQTEFAQPAILTHSLAAWAALNAERRTGVRAAVGHSLGEWSALVAAAALTLADAVRLVRLRGRLMQQATPFGVGAMAAILGLDGAAVAQACAEAGCGEVVSVAGDNDGSNQVIAGHAAAVQRASELCLARGALRALPLPVSAPFHCALMAPAADPLREALRAVRFGPLAFPVRSTADDVWHGEADTTRELLVAQLTQPVLWRGAIAELAAAGATAALALGPAGSVPGMVKRTARSLKVQVVCEADELAAVMAA